MKKVYLFCPLPPIKSGIARYSLTLGEHLSRDYEVHFITDQTDCTSSSLYQIHHWKEFWRKPLEEDAAIFYQVGNSPYHRYIFPFLFTFPGIVVLHDFILNHVRFLTLHQNYSRDEIIEELKYCIGSDSSAKQITHLLFNGTLTTDPNFLFPELTRIIVEASLAAVVHNPDTREALLWQHSKEQVQFVPLGFWSEGDFPRLTDEEVKEKRKAFGFPQDAFLLGHFGVPSSYKRADQLIELLMRLHEKGCPAHLLVAGYETEDIGFRLAVQRHCMQNYVKQFHSVSDPEYRNLMQCIDVGYSLRFPPFGEFSLSTAEIMACGKPVILLKHRFSSYLPDTTCIHISPTNETGDLLESTLRLYRSPDLRSEMGMQASEYIRRENPVEAMLQGYRSLIEGFDHFKERWIDPGMRFPQHLQSLEHRFHQQLKGRFKAEIPETLLKKIRY